MTLRKPAERHVKMFCSLCSAVQVWNGAPGPVSDMSQTLHLMLMFGDTNFGFFF